MEEALGNIIDCITKQCKKLSLTEYRDLMGDLIDEVNTRYELAEKDLVRSGEA